MTTQGTQKSSATDEKKEIEALKAQIAELKKQLDVPKPEEPKDEKIQLDDYISVMSLLPFTLNLSTKEGGQGNIKKFTRFGEVKRILYKDLVDIIDANPQFLSAGFYYILDPRVIRSHGLDEVYSKILSKEKIEDILSANSEEGLSLYKSANEEQQKVIIGLMIDKLVEDPKAINLTVIDAISRASGIKIMDKVEDAQTLLKQLAEKE